MYCEDNDSLFIDGDPAHMKDEWTWRGQWGNADGFEERYLHPLWKNGVADDMHGGIDHLVFAAFLDMVCSGGHAPIDVYDAAVYMAITPLSENSIACGGAPMAFPDFTGGRWTMRTGLAEGEYALDRRDVGRDLYFVD